jgi:transcriptional regulator with XRE-family HTH domain
MARKYTGAATMASAGGKKKSSSRTIEPSRDIGARFRYVRRQFEGGQSQSDIADRLAISVSHYSKIESGISPFSERLLRDFCRQFAVRQKWLLSGVGPTWSDGAEPAKEQDADAGAEPQSADLDAAMRAAYEILIDDKRRTALATLAGPSADSQVEALKAMVQSKMHRPV